MKRISQVNALMIFSFVFSNAYAVTTEFKINNENKVREVTFKSLPSIKEHHVSIEQFLKDKLNVEAVNMLNETENSLVTIGQKNKEDALKSIAKAQAFAQSAITNTNSDMQIVEYNIEVINEAPYDLKLIKNRRKEINRSYFGENFPETRLLLASLQSEMHMQTFQISLQAYIESLKTAKTLVQDKKFTEAQALLSNLVGNFAVEDWGVPLPYVEAEAAISEAMLLKDVDIKVAKEKVELAEYQLDRADALGYVTGEKSEFKALKKDLKAAKKAILHKETFDKPFFERMDRFRGILISFIKKNLVQKLKNDQSSENVAQKNK